LLVQELENFRAKVTTAKNEGLESWREGRHDDLILAVAVAAWLGEHDAHDAFFVGLDLAQPHGSASSCARSGAAARPGLVHGRSRC